ncbi:lipopolysaccharide biosynthesis protein RfbH [Pectinatus frisingensis]|uniref:lipopolysaccharide biosynthesis protein RfbH n=1 Tax=Pectinatus frisingensis TaxID=865 RepID=UPI0039BFF7BD
MATERNMTAQSKIREKILASVREYYNSAFAAKKKFIPGNKINYGGRFFDEKELVNLVNASLDFWLTTGRYCSEFESNFAKFLDVRYCSLTNSGSSANLLAFMALTSAKLGERRVKKGDEVITVAAGFPTTVAPIIQYGAVPVFVDVTLPEYNIDVSMLEKAYSKRTKVVMVAHTLGNPFDLQTVRSFCDEHNLWLIEDNCDALGSEYYINGAWKYTGTIGDIGTSSFYPPHHMTMGEGGAVYTDNSQLYRIINSFRDWGRDCWCASGHDNTCQNRFSQQFGELPFGYDHKYVYSHFGYNLKATEMQAAIGCAQLKKLPFFIKKRRENWQFLWEHLSDLDEYFILPKASQNSKPSWFGFLITVREAAKFSRNEIVTYLEKHNIQTRMLFAGNLIKHPCFDEIRGNNQLYRVVGSLDNTDCIMERTFWLGVYPGIDELQLKFMLTTIRNFLKSR